MEKQCKETATITAGKKTDKLFPVLYTVLGVKIRFIIMLMDNKIVLAETAALNCSDYIRARSCSLNVFLFQNRKKN